MYDRFIGKTVAVRGIGSGVNVGRCVAVKDTAVLFEKGSFFCSSWTYQAPSHGAFHSLANGEITNGTITLVENETIIIDVAQIVLCNSGLPDKLQRLAKK